MMAIIGHCTSYPDQDSSGHAQAAGVIRGTSQEHAPLVDHWDFDLGDPLFGGGQLACADWDDIPNVEGTV
jgi:agmatinase